MKPREWTYKEEMMLCILYPIIPDVRELSDFFGRRHTAIKSKANVIGLTRLVPMPGKPTWTEKEQAFIEANYLTMPLKRIALYLNRSNTFVRYTMKQLGLVIPREIIEQRIADSRIKKGNVSFNKGKKQSEYMSPEMIERTKATRFKKGNLPHNAKGFKDGDVSIRRDTRSGIRYLYTRIRLGKWRELHHVIWEKKNGRIPPKHCLRFKDGNSLNCKLSNLELIPLSENMSRNTIRRYPKDLQNLIMLKGALKRKLNKYGSKKQNG